MALLRELQKFADDSVREIPLIPGGEPNEGEPDTGHPDYAAIVAARAFREKIQMATVMFAGRLASGGKFGPPEIVDRDPYPSVIGGTNTEISEAEGWSQAVLANPKGDTLTRAFSLALVSNPNINTADPFATIAFIRALGTATDYATDQSLRTALIPLLPLMAKGYRVGR